MKAKMELLKKVSRMIKRITKKIMKRQSREKSGFYMLASSCQINNLSQLYELFLGKTKNGSFVEYGAYDGETFSNTSGLADLGWGGLYIEPVTESYLKCVERHKQNSKVQVEQYAVGSESEEVEIFIGGPLSTIKKDILEKFQNMEWSKGLHSGTTEIVKMKSLNEILTETGMQENFDVLSIDVEGYEWDSLRGFNLKGWNPKIIIIELHDNNVNYPEEWKSCISITNYFESNYRIIYKDYSNTIFIRRDLNPIEIIY
jgi:FkbM family methyltransferase